MLQKQGVSTHLLRSLEKLMSMPELIDFRLVGAH